LSSTPKLGWKINHTFLASLVKYKIYLLSLIVTGPHEGVEDIHGDGEDDGAVVFRGDTVEGLEVSEL